MVSQLYLKDSFTNPNIDFLISTYIREYDIQKANISILLSKGLITEKQYNYFLSLNRQARQYTLGCMQRDDKEINRGLNEGFKEYRQKFFEANNIQDEDVLSINKDAIYLVNKTARYTTFDRVNFINKECFTSYYRYNRYGMFYFCDRVNSVEKFVVKGMQKQSHLHDGFMNDLLMCVFECAEMSIQEAIFILSKFLDEYMNEKVDSGFYREFNDNSIFRTKKPKFSAYGIDILDERNIDILDKSYNRRLMETLLSYYSSIFIPQIKRM